MQALHEGLDPNVRESSDRALLPLRGGGCGWGFASRSLHARNGDYPTPMNAWCPHRMVGACSGAAAAVTAGQVDFAVAMDTLGSVAVPAAYCGAFAFRFTHHPEVRHSIPPTRIPTRATLAKPRAEPAENPLKATLVHSWWR